jgi:RimJ/RimL family protein N-acetyltransferase
VAVRTPRRDLDQQLPAGRATLTPLVPADADEMAGVLADPELYRFTGGEPPDVDALRARYARLAVGQSADGTEDWFNWIVRDPDGAAVGTVQATVTAGGDHAEIAWVIGVPWQGRGYATAAAQALVAWLRAGGVRRVVARVHPDHAASVAVARRAGLEPTDRTVDGEQEWGLATGPG